MKNVNGDELYDWMAVLECLHVKSLHQMPAHMGDPVCARMAGTFQRCESCRDQWRAVTYAGLWDWQRWEAARDERWRREHAVSLGHAMGWCACEPEQV